MYNFWALLDDVSEIAGELGMKTRKLIRNAGEDDLMVAARRIIARAEEASSENALSLA